MRGRTASLIGLALFVDVCGAPAINHFAPHAVLPGRKTRLTFSGSGLDSASNLWTSFGGVVKRVANTNDNLTTFEVICPPDITGIHALQILGPEGASNFQLVLVDDLRTQSHENKHQSATNALPLTPPVAVDCILKTEQIDYYKFAAKAGEKFSIEAIAHRMGSEMDPVVRILDVNQNELLFCDDEPGVWRDSRFEFTAPATGDFLIAVHDSGYGGGSNFDYRLRVTRQPLTWFTFPLVDPKESTAPFEAIGTISEPALPSPADPPRMAGLGSLPAMSEIEPNNSAKQAQALFLPAILNGKIVQQVDADWFSFSAEKEQKLIFQSQTRSLGSPCDLVLTIKTPQGKTIVQSDSNLHGDTALTNTFAEGGQYLLEIRELSGHIIPNVPYRVKVAAFQRGIVASAENNRLEVAKGGTATLKLTFTRYDYPGPLTLIADNPNVILENAEVPEKKNEIELRIKASDAMQLADTAHFRIKVFFDGADPSARVVTTPALRKAFPLMLTPPPVLEGLFSLMVKRQ